MPALACDCDRTDELLTLSEENSICQSCFMRVIRDVDMKRSPELIKDVMNWLIVEFDADVGRMVPVAWYHHIADELTSMKQQDNDVLRRFFYRAIELGGGDEHARIGSYTGFAALLAMMHRIRRNTQPIDYDSLFTFIVASVMASIAELVVDILTDKPSATKSHWESGRDESIFRWELFTNDVIGEHFRTLTIISILQDVPIGLYMHASDYWYKPGAGLHMDLVISYYLKILSLPICQFVEQYSMYPVDADTIETHEYQTRLLQSTSDFEERKLAFEHLHWTYSLPKDMDDFDYMGLREIFVRMRNQILIIFRRHFNYDTFSRASEAVSILWSVNRLIFKIDCFGHPDHSVSTVGAFLYMGPKIGKAISPFLSRLIRAMTGPQLDSMLSAGTRNFGMANRPVVNYRFTTGRELVNAVIAEN